MAEQRPKAEIPTGLVMLGALAIIGSLVAIVYAWGVAFFACDETTSAACARENLAHLQLWVAIAGAGFVISFFMSAVLRRVKLARLLLVCSLLLYISWGILNDAAVHGWSSVP